MEKLSPNWITDGLLDFEYKKYILLAYLQKVSKSFDHQKLYPFLTDLVFHHKNLTTIKEKKEVVKEQMPKELKEIDLKNFKLKYERMMHDEDYLEELEQIIDFAIPKIQEHLAEGKELYDLVEEHLEINPVGILPLKTEFGYLMVRTGDRPETKIFQYELTIFENAEENFRGLKTNYITTYTRSLATTYETMKLNLMKEFKDIANPATFLIASKIFIPFNETFFPVARRSFMRYISTIG